MSSTCHRRVIIRRLRAWEDFDPAATDDFLMNAIKQVRRYLEQHPDGEASFFLAELVEALGEEREISLSDLYSLDHESFELAIELIKDWRLDRYYAARIRLFDVVLAGLPAREKRRNTVKPLPE